MHFLLVDTSGYDFTNLVDGDTYVFLLGDTLPSWQGSREDFIALSKYTINLRFVCDVEGLFLTDCFVVPGGPTPMLPDYAFGSWFTRWYHYTERLAKDEIARWDEDKLPLDVW